MKHPRLFCNFIPYINVNMHHIEEYISLMNIFMNKKCGCGTRVDKTRVTDPYRKCRCRTQGKPDLTKQYTQLILIYSYCR